jgi:NAD(P)-dependent dehydrogenase (short-subunit alcohol dehydrogenase family)
MKTNYYANVYITKYALPYLKRSLGQIVLISSISGKVGLPSRSAYCASKFAVTGFF